jgi:peptide/nickel transport system substrate-binding protein
MTSLRRPQAEGSRLSLLHHYFRYLYSKSTFDRALFAFLTCVFLLSGAVWLWQQGAENQTVVPTRGGTLHEGIVGSPRFVNPVLAITRADQDMASLIYRGLYTVDADGTLVPDLAEAVTISEDGRVYNITLKTDQYWHDETPITANDVVYTIAMVQNPELKSPVRGNWNDVTVELIGSHELNLILEEPYTPFSENLTLGILPRHLWEQLSTDEFPFSQYNTTPVGSGPFRILRVVRGDSGLIERYDFEVFPEFTPTPALTGLAVHFFADEVAVRRALEAGDITHTAALDNQSVAALKDTYTVYTRPLPRVFALYPNQNRNAALRDIAARRALSQAIDRETLIADVLNGYGEATALPLPSGYGLATTTSSSSLAQATETLLAGGWKQTSAGGWEKDIDDVTVSLAVTITTANVAPFEDTAEFVRAAWDELGVDVSLALYEQSDLVQAVIRPRDYELLLFGTDIGRQLDFYPFWHSSQREDPGLNVALYTNIAVDETLEAYRTTREPAAQADLLATFIAEMRADQPAIFLFNPQFTYVTRSDIPMDIPIQLTRPSERFATLPSWHIQSESLWPMVIKRLENE